MSKDTLLYNTTLGAVTAASTGQKYNAGRVAAHGGAAETLTVDENSSLPAVYSQSAASDKGGSGTSLFVEQPAPQITVRVTTDDGEQYMQNVSADLQEKLYEQQQNEILKQTAQYVRENAEKDENGNIIEKNYIQEYLSNTGRAAEVTEATSPDNIEWPGAYIPEGVNYNYNNNGSGKKKSSAVIYGLIAAGLLLTVAISDDDKKENK